MKKSSYDLLVIGAGAAGGEAAHVAVERGARVALIERDKIGGTCLNYGCDPTKTLLHTAQLLYQAQHSQQYGLVIPRASLDWRQAQKHAQQVINQMRGGTSEESGEQLRQQGIEYIQGEVSFLTPHEVKVNGQSIFAERVIIAAGSQTLVPEVEGLNEVGFITNIGALELQTLPARLAIIGGGAIGIEFAQMFHRFGVEVTVIERGPSMLDKEDRELADVLCNVLSQEGIRLYNNAELRSVQKVPGGKKVVYHCGEDGEQELVVDEILLALGRRPAFEKLGLEQIGVKTSKKGIDVDENLRTSVPHIWAAGDVTSNYKFTHVANEQGRLAAQNAFATSPQSFAGRVISWVTFTDPPLAHVGQTEEELRQQKRAYKVGCVEFHTLERAITLGQTTGLLKLLADEQGHILGGHILGPQADELLAPVILAMRANIPAEMLATTIFPYPTLSEGLRLAASQLTA